MIYGSMQLQGTALTKLKVKINNDYNNYFWCFWSKNKLLKSSIQCS